MFYRVILIPIGCMILVFATIIAKDQSQNEAAAATTRIVGAGGFSSIALALQASSAGDTVRVRAGVYPEQVTIDQAVTVEAYGDGQVWIDAECNRDHGFLILASGVAVRNIGVKRSIEAAVLIDGSTGTHPANVTISGNTIQDYDCRYSNGDPSSWGQFRAGIAAWYSGSGITIVDNTIRYRVELSGSPLGSADGIWFKSNDANPSGGNHTVARNTITGGWDGIGGEEEGSSRGTFDRNSTIEDNTISTCWDDGIQAEGGGLNVTVRRNNISGCGTGIAFAAPITGPLNISANSITNLATGLYGNLYCFKVGNSSLAVVNLTDNICRPGSGGADGIHQTNEGMFRIVGHNNVYSVSRYIFEITEPPAGLSFDGDCMYTTDPSRFVKWSDGALHTSLSAFRSATGQEFTGYISADCSGPQPSTAPTLTPGPTGVPDADGDGTPDDGDLGDSDSDSLPDNVEYSCGSSASSALRRPERIDSQFLGVDDDGDTIIDEGLPATAAAYDCDRDGFTGELEAHVFSRSTADEDPCGTNAWPADITSSQAANRINVSDLATFVGPTRRLNTSPGNGGFSVRWDLIKGSGGLGPAINVLDMSRITTLQPPMLFGRAFNGPACPWP